MQYTIWLCHSRMIRYTKNTNITTIKQKGDYYNMNNTQVLKLNDNVVITEPEKMLGKLKEIVRTEVRLEEICEYINSHQNVFFYIDGALGSDMNENKNSVYLWVDTGLKDNRGKPIFISLVRNRENAYAGYFVGTAKDLAGIVKNGNPLHENDIKKNLPKFNNKYIKKREEAQNKEQDVPTTQYSFILETTQVREPVETPPVVPDNETRKNTSIYDTIYDSLYINNWKAQKGLERYIKIIGCRAAQLVDSKKKDYYMMNSCKYVVVNTGLFNKYKQDIYVLYQWHEKEKAYIAHRVISTKRELLEERFDDQRELKDLKPIDFFDENEKIAFHNCSVGQFELTPASLDHILEERIDRFPDELKNDATSTLADKLQRSLEVELRILERDSSYIKPSYSAKSKSIMWYLPCHLDRDIKETPELVFVIRKVSYPMNQYYEVKTILPYNDELLDKMRALSLYGGLW